MTVDTGRRVKIRCLLVLLIGVPAVVVAEEPDVVHLAGQDGERIPANTVAPVYPQVARRDRSKVMFRSASMSIATAARFASPYVQVRTGFSRGHPFVRSAHPATSPSPTIREFPVSRPAGHSGSGSSRQQATSSRLSGSLGGVFLRTHVLDQIAEAEEQNRDHDQRQCRGDHDSEDQRYRETVEDWIVQDKKCSHHRRNGS